MSLNSSTEANLNNFFIRNFFLYQNPQMAGLRMCLCPKIPQQPLKFPMNPFPSSMTNFSPTPKTLTITTNCSNSNQSSMSDAELASDLSKMNSLFAQKEEAMKKSREVLFAELCQYLNSKSTDDVKKKWRKLDEEEKWVLVRGFVSEWALNFHPLSAKSVKQLVEEHLLEQNPPAKSSSSAASDFFSGFKRMMGRFPHISFGQADENFT